jgi:antibiotic biosynthesis monooxygenase (ABM) superfamily enzyme
MTGTAKGATSSGAAPSKANAAADVAASRPMPSVHLRAFVTWLVIFPLVAIGLTILGPLTTEWHPILRALVLTLVIVPLAVYILVPRLLQIVVRIAAAIRRQTPAP